MKLLLLGTEESRFLRGIRAKAKKSGLDAEITDKYDWNEKPYYIADWETFASTILLPQNCDIDGKEPAVAEAILEALSENDMICEKNITIIGRGNAVQGLPEALIDLDATVTICHSRTKDLNQMIRYADVVIIAAPMIRQKLDLAGKFVINIGETPIDADYDSAAIGRKTTRILVDRFKELI